MEIGGVKDHAYPIVFPDLLATDFEATRVVKLDTGHWFELENPDDVGNAL
jgi:hypothetical protein